ncbi:hypothetical protein FBU30_002671, partial [Linnemannia zychae]
MVPLADVTNWVTSQQQSEETQAPFRSDLRKILNEKDKATAQRLIKIFRETWSAQRELLDYLNKNYFGRP